MEGIFMRFVKGIMYSITAIAIALCIGAAGALAQSSGLLGTVIVNIAQNVPIVVDVAVPDADGEMIEASIPMTVGVNLAISIDGTAATVLDAEEPTITAEEKAIEQASDEETVVLGQLDDLSDAPYTIATVSGIEVTDVAGEPKYGTGKIQVTIKNTKDTIMEDASAIMAIFDVDGNLIAFDNYGSADSDAVAPDAETFVSLDIRDYDKIASSGFSVMVYIKATHQ